MENPFNPGSGTEPPFLAGRNDDLNRFTGMLKSISTNKNANMMLVGLRGTGKTVLLNEFSKMCIQKKIFPIKRQQFNPKHSNPKDFLEALKYDMYTAMISLSLTKRATEKIKITGTKLKPKKIELFGDLSYEPTYESRSIPFENQIYEYLSANWSVFNKRGFKGVVFLFDEFHYVSNVADKEHYVLSDFIGTINELQKNGLPYHLVLAGMPKLSLGIKMSRPYSERMFEIISLDNLTRDDATMAISKPLSDIPVKFEKKLIESIVQDTGRYPYFIQFYCKEIIDNIDKKKITLRDYERIRPMILKHLENSFFDKRINILSNTEESLLVSMSKITTKDMRFGDIVRVSGIRSSSSSRHLAILEAKDILHNHKHGVYRFSLPMLREYIIRRYEQ